MEVDNNNGTTEQAQVAVLMVPFTAHSHLNQLLQLSCLISSYNIPVHYASFSSHVRQVKTRFNDVERLEASNIHFHGLQAPPYPSPPPNPNSPTNFPAHLQPSFEATLELRHPLAALLREIAESARRVVVIHDALMAYVVQDIGSVPNAEGYVFNPISAFSSFFDGWQMMGKTFPVEEPENLPDMEGCHTFEIINFICLQCSFLNMKGGSIINSCRSIEGAYIDLLGKDQNGGEKKVWAVGPLSPKQWNGRHKCLEWLDKQAPRSVLYVSFGTTTSLKDEQIKELAMGLEESKQQFIWVLRDSDKGDICEGEDKRAELPAGFEERIREFGMVVRDWAPQLEILGHPSTGGFMGHCGWNSCLESITTGVPIAAWPMHSDQPKNAYLVTDILRIGVIVREWAQRKELVSSSTISKVVKRLMASEEGEEMRRRAEELGGSTRKAVEEGGVSRVEMDSFIAHISR
ncbi:Trans-zeatin O-beta-D-glucosyltransferase [Bertholletia excelsa]